MSTPGPRAQAMVLAAGRGERMRPLTDNCPKPLLQVRGKPLMQYHLEALARGGVGDVAVNTGWLGEQIEAKFGSQLPGGPRILYSHEGRDFGAPIETAGGMARALPLLADPFWLVAGDVYMPEFLFARAALEQFQAGGKLAHLFLVPNPEHNPKGDFGLGAGGLLVNEAAQCHTYSTVGLFRHALLASLPHGNPEGIKAPLAPLLRAAMARGEVTGELYLGPWTDVGTPERLGALNS